MANNGQRKKFHIILPLCMAVIVVLLDILFIAISDKTSSETENRNLQQSPKLSWNTFTSGRFESQFDDYVADQFPFRDTWIGVETTVARLAGKTESNDIFLGSDGYLIQKFDEPTEAEYQEKLTGFTDISSAHSDLNIYALIAPTAVSVLSYRLPANARGQVAGDEDSFIDRLMADLESAGIQTVDVRSTLKELDAAGTQVYYRTDHHWTTDAAYAAYKSFAGAAGIEESDVAYDRLLVTDSFQGTLTASSGFRTSETDSIYVYLPQETQDPSSEETTAEDTASEETSSQNSAATGDANGTAVDYTVLNVDSGEKSATLYDISYLETRDKYAMFLGGNHAELKIQTTSQSEKNLLIMKDSYANCFIPFLVQDYRTIVVVDPRYYLGDLDQLISDEGITDILFLYNAETL